jgi:hypothetical protein
MSAVSVQPMQGKWPSGVYLLWMRGVGVDVGRLQNEVVKVPHFPLGESCYLVALQGQEVQAFSDAVAFALPGSDVEAERDKAEFLLCPLLNWSILQNNAGGLGLNEWLNEHRRLL